MLRWFFVYAIHLGMAQALCCLAASAQDTVALSSVESGPTLSPPLLSAIGKKAETTVLRLGKAADRYGAKLQRQEHRLKKKIYKRDSTLARELFPHIDQKFPSLKFRVPYTGKYAVVSS